MELGSWDQRSNFVSVSHLNQELWLTLDNLKGGIERSFRGGMNESVGSSYRLLVFQDPHSVKASLSKRTVTIRENMGGPVILNLEPVVWFRVY